MSTWTNSALGASALLALAGCAGLDFALPSRGIAVQGGEITVMPPQGYCANPAASTDSSGSAVVLMGRCSATSAAAPALITASIGAAGTGAALDAGPVALTQFFTTDQGRGMLASTGKPQDAVVRTSESEETALLLQIKDVNLGDYWRAILAVKGRLVMLSATGADRVSLPPSDGRALLSRAMTSLRKANGEVAKGGLFAAPAPAPASAAAAPTTAGSATPSPTTAPITLRPAPRPRVPTSG